MDQIIYIILQVEQLIDGSDSGQVVGHNWVTRARQIGEVKVWPKETSSINFNDSDGWTHASGTDNIDARQAVADAYKDKDTKTNQLPDYLTFGNATYLLVQCDTCKMGDGSEYVWMPVSATLRLTPSTCVDRAQYRGKCIFKMSDLDNYWKEGGIYEKLKAVEGSKVITNDKTTWGRD